MLNERLERIYNDGINNYEQPNEEPIQVEEE